MSSSTAIKRCRKVLRVVAELHLRGYQRLRIAPGMSPSGGHWRCAITPASNVLVAHGAMLADWNGPVAHYTTGMENRYFDWADAAGRTPSQLADLFLERFGELAALGRGRDWLYAGWFVEMLALTYPDHVPIVYADYLDHGPESRWMPTLSPDGTREVAVPMPPPGEAAAAR